MGNEKNGGSILEISYAIGLPLGIILFFNHFSKIKLGNDPTPMQVQMRLYEEDLDKTLIENASREGKTIDVL
jgi:stage V sporulation protein AA